MSKLLRSRHCLALLAFAWALAACAPLISKYDPVAYSKAVDLKVESLALEAKATEPYEQHKAEAEALNMSLQKAYEYAQGRPNNSVSAQQWQLMVSPDKALMGGFLKDWKAQGKMNQVYLQELADQIGKTFDSLIRLESDKLKAGN